MLTLVVGTGRCGSTLVQEVLARHPSAGFVSGLDDRLPRFNRIGRFNGPIYRHLAPRQGESRARGQRWIAPTEAYRLLDRHVFAGFSAPCRDLVADDLSPIMERRVRSFFDTRARRQDCKVLFQHLTGWPRTGFLHAAYPELRVIHVVRDGRAVANSWLQTPWWDGWRGPDAWRYGPLPPPLRHEWEESGRSFAVLAALCWKMLMDAYAQARMVHPGGQWLDVRYEELVRAPNEQVARMLKFLGLEWTPQFEKGFARHRFHTERGGAYRYELTATQVAAIERVLDKPLRHWAYE
ncbi:sulfotransferase family protein [Phytohabitans rumicis]|uniref:Sulfotransferase n=1 Tax=Phytohabitans rumicis TaxID=1076125 RepID=A0A6V8LBM9_9ACTN|nr:sulfotransferase [Phytohabitans rumicis]GFJ92181.1 hypothetical protein Prum_058230 [Phytohabitans rumicis]